MSLTHTELQQIHGDLDARLADAQVQKVFSSQRSPDREWILQVRAVGETHYLLLSIDEDFGRLHLVDGKPVQPETPSSFTMLMRKWVAGSRLTALELHSDDRVIDFGLTGHEGRTELTLELTGRAANLVLKDASDNTILGAARYGERIQVGRDYAPPTRPAELESDQNTRFSPDSLHEAIDTWATEGIQEREVENARKRLRGALKSAAKRLRRLYKNVEGDLERALEAADYRKWGELLQSAYGKVPAGAESVTVTDYYDEDLKSIEIPLEPEQSLQENIDRYFHEYRRLADAQDAITERLEAAEQGLEKIEKARDTLTDLHEVENIERLEQKLLDERVIRPKQKQRTRRDHHEERKPYDTYKARSGATIMVGRGAKENDALTLKVARGRDIWLHARDWPGSHVLLRMDSRDESPQSEDLIDAATLAAHYSKGRGDTLVDVTYTEAKHIRKPRGAAPGLVSIAGGSTIAVNIEQKRLDRLFSTRNS